MSDAHEPRPSHVTVWVWLVVLLAAGLVVFAVPIDKTTATVLVFAIAAVKAFLVGRHYMHLRAQPPMLYALIGIPVVLAIALVVTLLPDIAYR